MYIDSNGAYHGYVRTAAGAITTFDISGAGSGAGQGTAPASINTAGTIAGSYFDSSKIPHGFVRSASGVVTAFDVAGATLTAGRYQHSGNDHRLL